MSSDTIFSYYKVHLNKNLVQSRASVNGVGAPIKIPDWFSLSNIHSICPDFRRR